MQKRFGISYGSRLPHEEYSQLVIKNGMVIDHLGNVATFTDLHPVSLAAIQSEAEDFGVLLAIGEHEQDMACRDSRRIPLQYHDKADFLNTASPGQTEALAALAAIETNSTEPLDDELVKVSKDLLPAIWYSEIAIVKTGLLFRDGRRHDEYRRATDYVLGRVREVHEQAHREWNVGIRSHLVDMGMDMREVPKPELDDQRRAEELTTIDPEYYAMLTRADTMQLADLSTEKFAVTVAKAVIATSKAQ